MLCLLTDARGLRKLVHRYRTSAGEWSGAGGWANVLVVKDNDLVLVPGGVFRMGSDDHYPEEAPAREVEVGDLWVARTTVTNAAFAAFVADTGYDAQPFPGRQNLLFLSAPDGAGWTWESATA